MLLLLLAEWMWEGCTGFKLLFVFRRNLVRWRTFLSYDSVLLYFVCICIRIKMRPLWPWYLTHFFAIFINPCDVFFMIYDINFIYMKIQYIFFITFCGHFFCFWRHWILLYVSTLWMLCYVNFFFLVILLFIVA